MSKKILLGFIILLALFLRLYKLEQYPVSLSWDEAAIGYNAYSILTTGADEYGIKYPALFRSFSDYKLPGYIYLTALSERFFWVNEFAVRLPSVILGTLTVLMIYFLVREIFENSPSSLEPQALSSNLPLIAASLLTISSWHLQFSRAGFEANGQLFFLVTGFYFLFRGLRRVWSFVLAAIFLGLSFYFYYTTRILTPLLVLVFLVLYRKKLVNFKKQIIVSIVIFILIIFPLAPHFLGKSSERISQVSIFNEKATNIPYSQAMARHPDSLVARIIYNRRLAFANSFLENYFRNNSLEFLFISGDLYPRHDILGMGLLYLWELPFFFLGIYSLAKWKDKKKWFIFSWWLVGGIPASLTTGAPHALRTLSTLPVFIIFTSLGLFHFINFLLQKSKKVFIPVICSLLFVISYFFISYLYFYYDFTAVKHAIEWGDGHKQLVKYIKEVEENYDEIYITGRYFKPYIYFLFYSQYDPQRYQEEGSNDLAFGKYKFYPADWEGRGKALEEIDFSEFSPEGRVLFVFPPSFVKKTLKTVKIITGKFNQPVFVLQEIEGGKLEKD